MRRLANWTLPTKVLLMATVAAATVVQAKAFDEVQEERRTAIGTSRLPSVVDRDLAGVSVAAMISINDEIVA